MNAPDITTIERDATINFSDDGDTILRAKWYAPEGVLRIWRPNGEPVILDLHDDAISHVEVHGL